MHTGGLVGSEAKSQTCGPTDTHEMRVGMTTGDRYGDRQEHTG